jgi:hypothetical protein
MQSTLLPIHSEDESIARTIQGIYTEISKRCGVTRGRFRTIFRVQSLRDCLPRAGEFSFSSDLSDAPAAKSSVLSRLKIYNENVFVLKGHGFSRAKKCDKVSAALAAEECFRPRPWKELRQTPH